MQQSAQDRLRALAAHLGPPPAELDISELQRLLEHDNHDTRAKLKELMKDDLYLPCVSLTS